MADNIPNKLVDLPDKMEKIFEEGLPYPADAEKYMLDLYKKIEKNLSLSKRVKRKISKTFKKVFTNKDLEKGSLKNENKTFIDNFNYLYAFFHNNCNNKEIDEAKNKIDKISNLNKNSKNNDSKKIISEESIEITKNIGCLYPYKTDESAKAAFNYKSFLIGSCRVIDENVSRTVSIYGRKNLLSKNFKAFCDMIIKKEAPENFKEQSTYYYDAIYKLQKLEKEYAEGKKFVDTFENFLNLDVVKKSGHNKSRNAFRKKLKKIKNKLLGLKSKIKDCRAILYYGGTFSYDKENKRLANASISPLIEAGNKYNKKCENLITYIKSPKTTSEQIKETLDKINSESKIIFGTATNCYKKYLKTENDEKKNDYEQNVLSVYNELNNLKAERNELDNESKNMFKRMQTLIKRIENDNSLKSKMGSATKNILQNTSKMISNCLASKLSALLLSLIAL